MQRHSYPEIRFVRNFILSPVSSSMTMQFLIVACALLGVALGQFTEYNGNPGNRGDLGFSADPGNPGYSGFQHVKPFAFENKESKTAFPASRAGVANRAYGRWNPRILENSQVMYPNGAYAYKYRTENGIYAAENGIYAAETGGPYRTRNGLEKVVNGKYGYISPEGIPVNVVYTADGSGFHPTVHIGW
ncbi:uncharacterized protein LOC107222823 [Neodiprion lecontei]|uniref:Uncharacterized protein LOC107222823 n=1 Tax=Neodiprion lecontei TaxID=441921 RepID=A0A6J0BTU8_NEOLC|nr:uncharacterized protein LOC107222823 [Neodiprion lecontei]XP_046594622.1 uncharacterized protein LOC107222823 [Neodiprion lecontei]